MLQVYDTVAFALPTVDGYSSWQQQQPAIAAPAAQQFAGGYNQQLQTYPEQYPQQPQYTDTNTQLPGAVCYVGQQQEGDPMADKAGGGYMTSGQAAGPPLVGQDGYPVPT